MTSVKQQLTVPTSERTTINCR